MVLGSRSRLWMALVAGTAVALFGVLPPVAAQESGDSSRDAFLEGWFQETAEGDLEAALKEYRRCVQLAGDGDQAVAARALFRMGTLALARGDAEAARATWEQLGERYPESDAAEDAKRALDGRVEAAPLLPISDAAAQAKEYLRTAIVGPFENPTSPRMLYALRNLSIEQILATNRECGGTADWMNHTESSELTPEDVDKLVALAMRTSVESRVTILNLLKGMFRDQPVPQKFLSLADSCTANEAHNLVTLYLSSRSAPALDSLLRLAKREDLEDGRFLFRVGSEGRLVWDLQGIEENVAAAILETLLGRAARISAQDFVRKLLDSTKRSWLTQDGRVSALCRQAFRTLSAQRRLVMHYWVGLSRSVGSTNAAKRFASLWTNQAIEFLLADPSPSVRGATLRVMMSLENPEWHARVLVALRKESRAQRLSLLQIATARSKLAYSLEDLFAGVEGVEREFLYHLCLRHPFTHESSRSPREVVHFGLEHGDPELLVAQFAPRSLDAKFPEHRPLPGLSFEQPDTAFRELMSEPEGREEARRLLMASLEHPDERVRSGGIHLLRNAAASGTEWESYWNAIARDPSPRVLLVFLDQPKRFNQLKEETQVSLLLESAEVLFQKAVAACKSDSALARACASLPESRLATACDRATSLHGLAALQAIYERVRNSNVKLAWQCLRQLATANIDVVVQALRGPSSLDLKFRALNFLSLLPLEPGFLGILRKHISAIQGQAATPAQHAEHCEQIARILESNLDLVRAASRRQRIEAILATLAEQRPADLLARQLVGLEAREELRQLVLREGHAARVGGLGLLYLGDVASLREAFLSRPDLVHLLDTVVQAELFDEVFELLSRGRLLGAQVARALHFAGRMDILQAQLVDQPMTNWSMALYHPDGRTPLVQHLKKTGNVEGLRQCVRRYGGDFAVGALFDLGAYAAILEDLPSWPSKVRAKTYTLLRQRTGIGETEPDINIDEELKTYIERWREALP